MPTIEIIRGSGPQSAKREDVPSLPGVAVTVLDDPDKSDPFNELLCVIARFGDELALRVSLPRNLGDSGAFPQVMAALIGATIQNYAEIRDALAEKT